MWLSGYRYGFNGKENDNEVKGEGNQQDYGMRIYDPRIGRFLSVDPITKSYPELTPYQFASNRPIDGIDQDGLEHITANYIIMTNGQKTTIKLINYKWFNNEFHDVPGPKGAGVQYNISIINNDGSREQKQHFINRGAYAEYGSYYGSTPLMNLDGDGNFIPGTYNYDLPAVGTVDALAKTHDQAYDAVRAVGANGLFDDWATTPADEAAAKGWEAFASKYRPGDVDPAGGKVTTLAIESAKNGYTMFNMIVMNKKSNINNFMSANYSNAKHGSVFLWGKPHFSSSDREYNYNMFLQIYMTKGKDGRWNRNESMWNRNAKGEFTTPKKPVSN